MSEPLPDVETPWEHPVVWIRDVERGRDELVLALPVNAG
jgi:hypothetical protein